MIKSIHQISKDIRVRLGDVGIYKAQFIMERRKSFLFFYWWEYITSTPPSIHRTIEDAISFMNYKAKGQLANGDISKLNE